MYCMLVLFVWFLLFYSASLWFKYGLIKNDFVLIGVNGVGATLSFMYMMLYYLYTTSKLQVMKMVFLVVVVLFPLLTYIQYYTTDKDTAVFHLGMICASSSVVAYGSPLTELREVFRTKSTACLAFPLCLGNFVVSGEWLLYGIIKKDLFVKVPNGLGFFLGSFQLLLFLLYPPATKTTSTTENL